MLVFQEPLVAFCSWGIWMKLNEDFAAPFPPPPAPRPWEVKELLWGELLEINLPA